MAFEPLEERTLLALAGIGTLEHPLVDYSISPAEVTVNYTANYTAEAGLFKLNSTAAAFLESQDSVPRFINQADFQISIQVDDSGNLVGGVAGDDLVLMGEMDINGDNVIDPYTTLLTGEIEEFGYLESGRTDYCDFRFTPTGGALATAPISYFDGKDIGVEATIEGSTFTGDFTIDFGDASWVKGAVGLIEPQSDAAIDIEKYVKPFDCPGGGEGLTPGFWKQSQHFYAWTQPYDPGDNYNDVFGVNDDASLTLLDALARGGGEENALGRHATAALLNAAHPGIDYAFTTAQIISMVQSAYATGEFELTKDLFEAENELGGDLSDAGSSGACDPFDYGQDADEAPGLVVEVGDQVAFTYVVTNTGDVPLADVAVTDDNQTPGDSSDDFTPDPVLENGYNVGDVNRDGLLNVDETWLFTHVTAVELGQHTNVGTVTANAEGVEVSDHDPANWLGVTEGSTIQGIVWEDADNDGSIDLHEEALQGVTAELTGTDYLGNPVHQVAVTDSDGVYMFLGLQPSGDQGYTVHEIQPDGYEDGQDILGTVNGVHTGNGSVNDQFSGIVIAADEHDENYNFGEQPATGVQDFVHQGQTATIGYWQNKNGQRLIKSLNGGCNSTQLGNWLAEEFPNLYSDLAGTTNAYVADFYKVMFRSEKKKKSKTDGPAKLDPQIMAVAFAVYVTDESLAGGDMAASYGFKVTASGVGGYYFDVDASVGAGTAETLFGAGTSSVLSVLDILKMTDDGSSNGIVFDDGDGRIDANEAIMRALANELFTAINEAGDIK